MTAARTVVGGPGNWPENTTGHPYATLERPTGTLVWCSAGNCSEMKSSTVQYSTEKSSEVHRSTVDGYSLHKGTHGLMH